jgi:hypothetical protein
MTQTATLEQVTPEMAASAGYQKLLAAVEKDDAQERKSHDYRGKLNWVIDRANHYAEAAGLAAHDILNAWEERRDYWYMNYYQDAKQPKIEGGKVRVFDTNESAIASIGNAGFRCPSCSGVSKNPYTCDTGISKDGKVCDWKSYGLFGTLGKGATAFVKETMQVSEFFMPVAWEGGAE